MTKEMRETCPNCIQKKAEELDAAWENNEREEFEALREELEEIKQEERMSVTYSVMLYGEKVVFSYCASCDVCGLELSANEDIETEKKADNECGMTVEVLVSGEWIEVDESEDEINQWMRDSDIGGKKDLSLPGGGEITVKESEIVEVRERTSKDASRENNDE